MLFWFITNDYLSQYHRYRGYHIKFIYGIENKLFITIFNWHAVLME